MKNLNLPTPPASERAAPKRRDNTFYRGLPHRHVAAILTLLDSVIRGETADIAGALNEVKGLVQQPALFVGVGTTVKDRATGDIVPFMVRGLPSLRADSVIVYTDDPERDRDNKERAGALIRTFSDVGFVRSHPWFIALEAEYREEVGAAAPKPATSQIPAGAGKAVPAGDEEVTPR